MFYGRHLLVVQLCYCFYWLEECLLFSKDQTLTEYWCEISVTYPVYHLQFETQQYFKQVRGWKHNFFLYFLFPYKAKHCQASMGSYGTYHPLTKLLVLWVETRMIVITYHQVIRMLVCFPPQKDYLYNMHPLK